MGCVSLIYKGKLNCGTSPAAVPACGAGAYAGASAGGVCLTVATLIVAAYAVCVWL